MTDSKYSIENINLENIRNANEINVIKVMRTIPENYPDFCSCSICMQDVYAGSLNFLPPKYKQQTSIVLSTSKTPPEEIEAAVNEVVLRVMKNPNHS